MGDTVKDMTAKFKKLDKFEENDFRRWQKKMHFLLTTLKVVYVLSAPMPGLVEDKTLEQTRKRCKWENDDYICRGHILNEDASSKKFIVSNFNNYNMVDSRSVMEQYHELLRILGQFTQHSLNMDESISVSSIIDKLPPLWKDFKHSLKHNKDELSLVQLGSHFRIEETLRAEESDKGKGKEIVGSSSVNMIEDGKNKNNTKNNKVKKRKNNGNNDRSNKKSKLTCWKCGKTSHLKRIVVLKRTMVETLLVQDKNLRILIHHKDDVFAWWIDSGATCHAFKDRCWFVTFHPVQDGSVLYMGDESTKPILGSGNVVLEFSFGKTIALVNVVYVPGLRKNVMSGPVYYNNGMFMLNLNKVPNASSVCMISFKDVDSSMWHARLGHVHYKRMLVMSKDNLIPNFDITLGKYSVFARFNTIITSLKALGEGYSSKNYVRKFLRALHPKWRAKVTAIEESKDLTSLSLDELIVNLKVHAMIIKKDSEIVKDKGERRSLAVKAKKKSSDEECLTFRSEDEEYVMAVRDFKKFYKRRDKNQRAFVRGSWSDSGEEDDEKVKEETCLVAQASSELGLELDIWLSVGNRCKLSCVRFSPPKGSLLTSEVTLELGTRGVE
ncbi:zinc finger, CCHC-type containing protein [Tanacetum coccineum]